MNADLLREKLASRIVAPSVLFSNVKFLNPSLKDTPQYSDPNNYPFWYHLGKQLDVNTVLQIGMLYGAEYIGPCLLQSCKTVNQWLMLDEEAQPMQLGFMRSNLRLHMEGSVTGLAGDIETWKRKLKSFEFDMVIVSRCCAVPKFNELLEYGWSRLKPEGLLVVDYISETKPALPDLKGAFHKFCRVKNRTPEIFETRNGVGIIER